MAYTGRRKPTADEPFHSLPLDATMLASSTERSMPEIAHGETKVSHGMAVTRYSEITKMPAHNGLQPRANFRNRVMHSRYVPSALAALGKTRALSTSVQDMSLRARVTDRAGPQPSLR